MQPQSCSISVTGASGLTRSTTAANSRTISASGVGRRGVPIERSYNLGLLALLGALLLGASVLLQLFWSGQLPLVAAGLHTLVAQSLITGLLAPVLWL